ncbi:MAG: DoxX family protein [Gemmatimonadetes bacterium]|uniref:DoxX family protein n=1 Tax=Candidatus Kutchimonas denitrificans TaxID=3056748 RepID=A0AAE5C7M9_9BACT|nr:DoxX family protein [Gemmatimonadota bacterium]NIR73606.1 DoxX family protein [Candidatus Kutchimonas denitrificans]NIR99565.1 DoxX family protein [Gemmatimonadota bacterium]NIT65185.1 DoxX family protein [Gemmatimonadota bacterium]NIV23718.1 DoxX family membrane protein [Gemmatimonadota bacterium]
MIDLRRRFDQLDARLCAWMARYAIRLLRISLGIVFLWFGFLKFFPNLSPAQELATRTIEVLSFGLAPPEVSRPLLAAWESAIGVGLILGIYLRATLLLLWLQMLGTLTPLFLFPGEAFIHIPSVPSMEGQYIIKNLVLISAGIVIGSTVRGGELTNEPRRT